MAYKIAIASGSWNDPAIWEDGVVPSGTDDVWANGYSISINQNLTFSGTLRNTAVPYMLPFMSIPVMTDFSVPSGTASSSSVFSPNFAWKAYNQNYSDYWQANVANVGWLKYQFPVGKIIKRYAFLTYSNNIYSPNNWTFEGSNDNTNWTVLETITNNTISNSQWYISPVLSNTISYLYYRINITSTAGAQTPVINEFNMTESINAVYGSVSAVNYGGNYVLGAGYTLNVNNIISDSRVSTGCVQYNASGASTIICPNLTTTQAPATIYVTGTGTLNINSVIGSTAVHVNGYAILTVGAASNPTINIQGNIVGGYGWSGSSSEINLIGNATINIVGNVYAGLSADSYAIRTQSGSSTINITGDVYGGGTNSFVFVPASGTTINITGNIYAGGIGILNTANTVTMTVTGNLNASATYYTMNLSGASQVIINGSFNSSSVYPAIAITSPSSLLTVSASTLIYTNGVPPFLAARVKYTASSRTWTFQKPNNTNKLLYTADLVSSGSGSYPLASNVRSGVSYGLGAYTGTMVVPAYQNVTFGIDVDNGKGIAYLSAASLNDISAAVWNQLISNITTTGSIGERLKNASTVAITGQQIAGFDV